ncbi:MAG: hypothetical protein HQM00_17070 [Magnetococcales bacterium]|nr:hypothetical protein [Magnetococcales bacterium]
MSEKSRKSKWPKNLKPHPIPIYGGDLYVIRDRETYQQCMTHLTGDPTVMDLTPFGGRYNQLTDKKTGNRIFLCGVFSGDNATLVHELFHIAFCVLDLAGVRVTEDNHEALAYLLGFLFRATRDQI